MSDYKFDLGTEVRHISEYNDFVQFGEIGTIVAHGMLFPYIVEYDDEDYIAHEEDELEEIKPENDPGQPKG